jgi:hypothetical protein
MAASYIKQIYPLLVAVILVTLTKVTAQPLSFNPSKVAGPGSNAPGELFTPAVSGTFPAMVVLQGCDGVVDHNECGLNGCIMGVCGTTR